MNRTTQILLSVLLIASLVGAAKALDYLWLSDEELGVYGDHIRFWYGDTLNGPVHSNSQIAILSCPVFFDQVSTTESDFYHMPGYDPCDYTNVVFNAMPVNIPSRAVELRQGAQQQGNYFPDSDYHFSVHFSEGFANIRRWRRGTFEDSTDYLFRQISLNFSTCIFVEGPVRVKGVVAGRVTVGSSCLIELDDDMVYEDSNSQGIPVQDSPNMLGLVSEGDIKIRNTPANGRENSSHGNSIVICGALYALGGSFTFENQNDPDSGYVCECSPDERGTIFLFGGVAQRQRGYLHRSNNGGTGYRRILNYDGRFRNDWPPCVPIHAQRLSVDHDTLNFGDVPVGITVSDTFAVHAAAEGVLGAAFANYPFHAVRYPPFQGTEFRVPVSFAPPRNGQFSGMLYISVDDRSLQIVLRGRGVPQGGPQPLTMNIAPNPFNLTTAIRFNLPEAGDVRIALYDILGREAKTISIPQAASGEHSIMLDAASLASGVYFVRLQTGNTAVSRKLLLLK